MPPTASRILAKIDKGELPPAECERIGVATVSAGSICPACDEVLVPIEGAVECRVAGRSFLLHPDCYLAWLEALRPRPAVRRSEDVAREQRM
jgi:hypothetical protein